MTSSSSRRDLESDGRTSKGLGLLAGVLGVLGLFGAALALWASEGADVFVAQAFAALAACL